jgi:hypothetical protein
MQMKVIEYKLGRCCVSIGHWIWTLDIVGNHAQMWLIHLEFDVELYPQL